MSYFDKVKKKDKVFGIVFGEGKVINVWEDSYYAFEVEFKTGDVVPYTNEGIPGWNSAMDFQTLFYAKDIDLVDIDFKPSVKTLSIKKIIKLRDKKKLEMKCPSGIWVDSVKCPYSVVEDYVSNEKYHLFRKKK